MTLPEASRVSIKRLIVVWYVYIQARYVGRPIHISKVSGVPLPLYVIKIIPPAWTLSL